MIIGKNNERWLIKMRAYKNRGNNKANLKQRSLSI